MISCRARCAESDELLQVVSLGIQTFTCVPVNVFQVADVIDLVLTLGGDGTMLWACSMFSRGPVPPVVPFAMGSLGFMTPFSTSRLESVLARVTSVDAGICSAVAILASPDLPPVRHTIDVGELGRRLSSHASTPPALQDTAGGRTCGGGMCGAERGASLECARRSGFKRLQMRAHPRVSD